MSEVAEDKTTVIDYTDHDGEKCSMCITSDVDGRGMIQLVRGCRVKSETRRCFRSKEERDKLLAILLREGGGRRVAKITLDN